MARNPKRIDTILDRIRFIWAKNRNLNFGQVITNVIESSPEQLPLKIPRWPSLWWLNDSDLGEALDKYIKQIPT